MSCHKLLPEVCIYSMVLLYVFKDLNITEVAHDYQTALKRYVKELGMVNSYDTWHGMV